MKTFVTAVALVIAAPALARTAPAAQPENHAQHQQQGQNPAPHGQHQPGQSGRACDCCCADRNNDGRMDCSEHMQSHRDGKAGHKSH
jgi:hypothetical protein